MFTVLVVDDSAVDRELAVRLLAKQLACEVLTAADGEEAIALLARQVPDLVLTDLQMPNLDGLGLVTAIKNNHPLVPVVLMTAQGSEDIAAEALRHGAASYVSKRRLAADLMPTVQRVLQASHADRQHTTVMHFLESDEATFLLPNDLQMIKSVVTHVQQMLRCLPLNDETERLRVGLALEEALKNAVLHGNLELGPTPEPGDRQNWEELARQRIAESPYRERRVGLRVHVTRQLAVFEVEDGGPGFDTTNVGKMLRSVQDTDSVRGRGLTLMGMIMDEIRHNERGNIITLVKRCSNTHVPMNAGASDEGSMIDDS